MAAAGTIHVEGLAGLNRAFRRIDKNLSKSVRKELASVAVPVQLEAQRLAVNTISGLRKENPLGQAQWAFMRVGVLTKVVYVAEKERGRLSRRNAGFKRPKFGTLLMDRAMQPALERKADLVVARMNGVLDTIGRDWER